MRRLLMVLAGAIALTTAACSGEQTASTDPSPAASSPAPAPSVAASPAAKPSPAAGQKPGTQPFNKPLVAQKPGPAGSLDGLIQSTNGNERADQVLKTLNTGRSVKDPFASFPTSPEPQTAAGLNTRLGTGLVPASQIPGIPPLPAAQDGSQFSAPPLVPLPNGVPANPPLSRRPTIARRPTVQRPSTLPPRTTALPPRTASRPNTTRRPTPSVTNRPTLPNQATPGSATGGTAQSPVAVVPTAPSTALIDGIEVTGVVRVGNTVQAIVQEPGKPTIYVQPGQTLANGQVRVKRIDLSNAADPVVVFEQNGVEVSKAVGEKPPQTQPGSV